MKYSDSSPLFETARNLCADEDYRGAFNVLAEVEEYDYWNTSELLLFSRIVLLGDDDDIFDFDFVECLLNKALKSEPENVEILLEIGHFYSSIMDRPKDGMSFFQKALNCSKKNLVEVLLAVGGSLDEQNRDSYCKEFLNELFKEVEAALEMN